MNGTTGRWIEGQMVGAGCDSSAQDVAQRDAVTNCGDPIHLFFGECAADLGPGLGASLHVREEDVPDGEPLTRALELVLQGGVWDPLEDSTVDGIEVALGLNRRSVEDVALQPVDPTAVAARVLGLTVHCGILRSEAPV